MNRPRYIGSTYYGHPYLDGRGFFPDGPPLNKPPADESPAPAKPSIVKPYVNSCARDKKAK